MTAMDSINLIGTNLRNLSARHLEIQQTLLYNPPDNPTALIDEFHQLEDDLDTLNQLNVSLTQTVLQDCLNTSDERRRV